jgi:hypothetical protein
MAQLYAFQPGDGLTKAQWQNMNFGCVLSIYAWHCTWRPNFTLILLKYQKCHRQK